MLISQNEELVALIHLKAIIIIISKGTMLPIPIARARASPWSKKPVQHRTKGLQIKGLIPTLRQTSLGCAVKIAIVTGTIFQNVIAYRQVKARRKMQKVLIKCAAPPL